MITYSSLISACEKAGDWKLALEFFEECTKDNCRPNVITFNSLISACSQGAPRLPQLRVPLGAYCSDQTWFSGICLRDKCRPNLITFNSLISTCSQGRIRAPSFHRHETQGSMAVCVEEERLQLVCQGQLPK